MLHQCSRSGACGWQGTAFRLHHRYRASRPASRSEHGKPSLRIGRTLPRRRKSNRVRATTFKATSVGEQYLCCLHAHSDLRWVLMIYDTQHHRFAHLFVGFRGTCHRKSGGVFTLRTAMSGAPPVSDIWITYSTAYAPDEYLCLLKQHVRYLHMSTLSFFGVPVDIMVKFAFVSVKGMFGYREDAS